MVGPTWIKPSPFGFSIDIRDVNEMHNGIETRKKLYPSGNWNTFLSVYLSIYLSVCLSIYLSSYLSIFLSICQSIPLPVYVSRRIRQLSSCGQTHWGWKNQVHTNARRTWVKKNTYNEPSRSQWTTDRHHFMTVSPLTLRSRVSSLFSFFPYPSNRPDSQRHWFLRLHEPVHKTGGRFLPRTGTRQVHSTRLHPQRVGNGKSRHWKGRWQPKSLLYLTFHCFDIIN